MNEWMLEGGEESGGEGKEIGRGKEGRREMESDIAPCTFTLSSLRLKS